MASLSFDSLISFINENYEIIENQNDNYKLDFYGSINKIILLQNYYLKYDLIKIGVKYKNLTPIKSLIISLIISFDSNKIYYINDDNIDKLINDFLLKIKNDDIELDIIDKLKLIENDKYYFLNYSIKSMIKLIVHYFLINILIIDDIENHLYLSTNNFDPSINTYCLIKINENNNNYYEPILINKNKIIDNDIIFDLINSKEVNIIKSDISTQKFINEINNNDFEELLLTSIEKITLLPNINQYYINNNNNNDLQNEEKKDESKQEKKISIKMKAEEIQKIAVELGINLIKNIDGKYKKKTKDELIKEINIINEIKK